MAMSAQHYTAAHLSSLTQLWRNRRLQADELPAARAGGRQTRVGALQPTCTSCQRRMPAGAGTAPCKPHHRVSSSVLPCVLGCPSCTAVWYLCFGRPHETVLTTGTVLPRPSFKTSYPKFVPLINAFYTSNLSLSHLLSNIPLRNCARLRTGILGFMVSIIFFVK